LIIYAKITGGKTWLIDMISAPNMEIPEIMDKMKEMTEIYMVVKWFCDSAYPAYIKMLKRTKTLYGPIPAVGVKKGPDSVIDGITCVQSKIVDSNNDRHFLVLKSVNTERVFDAMEVYKWKLDGKGDPIDGTPLHEKNGTADIMDSIRYYFFSMFGKGSKILFEVASGKTMSVNNTLQGRIDQITGGKKSNIVKSGRSKGIIWDI